MIAWLVEAMIASTVLMLAVLALRGPVAARFGARAAYLLWLLPVLRLALPRLAHAPEPIKAVPIRFDFTHLAHVPSPLPAPVAAAATPALDWTMIAVALWLTGAAIFLIRELGRHRRFLHTALRRSDHGFMLGSVAVRRSRAVRGPLATGLLRRFILLPEDFARRYNAEEQRLALAHELAHHQRGDLFANLAALLVLSLHWFNPVAHRAYRAFRADQEKACDATVLNGRPHCAEAYGRALVKSARAPMRATACALGPAAELKDRLTMIVRLSRSAGGGRAGLALAGAVVVSGLALTASGGIAATTPIAALRPAPAPLAILATSAPEAPLPSEAPEAPAAAEAPEPPETWSEDDTAEVAREAQEAARESAAAAAEAASSATIAAHASRIDAEAVRAQAMAQARVALEAQCRYAKPATGPETDAEAVARLSAGCVDGRAIQAEVARGLRQAAAGIRADPDMPDHVRARLIASFERAAARTEAKANR